VDSADLIFQADITAQSSPSKLLAISFSGKQNTVQFLSAKKWSFLCTTSVT
jgi:hypothetical protein